MPRLRLPRLTLCAAAAALLGALGCVDHNPPGTALYVWDDTTRKVLVWSDVNAIYDGVTTAGSGVPDPDRSITSAAVPSSSPLAWGGLTLDTTTNRLYLAFENGTVAVITNASTRNGSLSQNADTYAFTLGAGGTGRITNGVFGQASVDFTSDTLFVQEGTLDGSSTQVWRVPGASATIQGSNIANTVFPPIGVTSDTFGAGLASVPGGNAIALYGGGLSVSDLLFTYTGARLRQSSGGAFANPIPGLSPVGNVIIGRSDTNATGLSSSLQYGGLGFDSATNLLFVASQGGAKPVLVFTKGQFTTNPYNQAPPTGQELGDAAGSLPNLRTLAHGINADWLLGANLAAAPTTTSTGTGTSVLVLWKGPSSGGVTAVSATLPGNPQIRGMALGGGTQ